MTEKRNLACDDDHVCVFTLKTASLIFEECEIDIERDRNREIDIYIHIFNL